MKSMKIKKDDNVIIVAGKDRGKQGKVVQVFPQEEKVVVEKLNINKRHLRANKQGDTGQVVEFSAPLHVSKVQLLCSKCGKVTRVAIKQTDDGKKVRTCKKCQASL